MFLCCAPIAGARPLSERQVEYRGHTISLSDAPQARQCAAMVRQGIDMAEDLPADLRALSREVRELHCDPTPVNATRTKAEDSITGVYTIESLEADHGVIVFRRNPAYLAASSIAISMVSNGVYARRHREWRESGAKHAKASPELRSRHEWLGKVLSKSDLDLTLRAECEVLDAEYFARKALDNYPKDMSMISKSQLERGCL